MPGHAGHQLATLANERQCGLEVQASYRPERRKVTRAVAKQEGRVGGEGVANVDVAERGDDEQRGLRELRLPEPNLALLKAKRTDGVAECSVCCLLEVRGAIEEIVSHADVLGALAGELDGGG
jgi:hypothetical protein